MFNTAHISFASRKPHHPNRASSRLTDSIRYTDLLPSTCKTLGYPTVGNSDLTSMSVKPNMAGLSNRGTN